MLGASVVLAVPQMLGEAGDRARTLVRSRYTRTAFASAMVLALCVTVLVLRLSAPEIVYRQF